MPYNEVTGAEWFAVTVRIALHTAKLTALYVYVVDR